MRDQTYIKDADCTKDTPIMYGYPEKPIYGSGMAIRPRVPGKRESAYDQKTYLQELLPLDDYNCIIVLFSGGKDSAAAYFKLLELGVPKEKIELWHHDIDGGHPTRRMDWPCTQNYVRSFAKAEGVILRVSERVNGFWGEVYRVGASYPIEYEGDDGEIHTCPLSAKQIESERLRAQILAEMSPEESEQLKQFGCRLKFPAKSGDLSRRWCSAYLKIDVASAVLRNLESLGSVLRLPAKGSIAQSRYCSPVLKRQVGEATLRDLSRLGELGRRGKLPAKSGCHQGRWCSGKLKAEVQSGVMADLEQTQSGVRILIVSGERRGESTSRSKYNEMELHRCNATSRKNRLVHTWRPVIDHSEKDVWEIIRRHRTVPHPCYACGWNRCSCMMCIFSRPTLWAGIRELFPDEYEAFRQDEIRLGFTLDTKVDLDTFVGDAPSCVYHGDPKALWQLVTGEFSPEDIRCAGEWKYPAGAFHGAEGGPC